MHSISSNKVFCVQIINTILTNNAQWSALCTQWQQAEGSRANQNVIFTKKFQLPYLFKGKVSPKISIKKIINNESNIQVPPHTSYRINSQKQKAVISTKIRWIPAHHADYWAVERGEKSRLSVLNFYLKFNLKTTGNLQPSTY